ncbi:MAG: DUF2270 domain-containing protein [Candidatus Bipolaricaulota bacterium]|nr:DUF2270 domain-containing protein [Candidatus Bipolaricaulota bacterium]
MPEDKENEEIEPEITSDILGNVLVHLYRGEVQRVNTWRNRLDRTPYWSMVMVAGMITWAYASPNRHPALILLTIPITSAILTLEANRYQIHEVWRSRLRLLEENFLSNMLDPEATLPRTEWMKVLSNDLKEPEHKVSLWAALAVRLRRVYLWIFSTIILGWFMKITIHPTQAESLYVAMERGRIGFIPGPSIAIFLIVFFVSLSVLSFIGVYSVKEKREGEVLEEEPGYEWRRNEDYHEDLED